MSEANLRHEHTVRSTALFVATVRLIQRIGEIKDTSPWQAASAPIAGELAGLARRAAEFSDWLDRASREDHVEPERRAALLADPLIKQWGR